MDAVLNLEKMEFIKRSTDTQSQKEIINLTQKGLKIMQCGYRKIFRILDLSDGG